jgi:flagellar hook-length control protein FliK
MKTQSVITQGINLVGSSVGGINTKDNKSSREFNLMMDNNLKSLQTPFSSNRTSENYGAAKKIAVQKLDKNSASRPDDEKEAVKDTLSGSADQPKEIGATGSSSTQALSSTSDDNTVNQKQSDVIEQTEDEPTVDEELLAQIMMMLQSVQEVVMQQMNLTQEEFDQLLSDQGMSLSDLLQPEQLQRFILVSNGQIDISAVLTDENLAANMNDLMNSIEEIKADANLGLTDEQLQQILMQANSKEDTVDSLLTSGLQEQLSQAANLSGQVAVKTEAESESGAKKEITQTVNSDSQKDQADTMATSTVDPAKENLENTPDDSKQNQQRELKAADQFQAFIDNLVKTTQETQVNFNGNLSQVTELRDIANQILDRIKLSVSSNQASMELQLNPEHLGKVNLTVQSKNGIMTAQFIVQNELSKEAIESQLHVLRETLNAQGVKVEAIEVTVSAYAFDQNTEQNAGNQQETEKSNSGKKITLEDALTMSEDIDDSIMPGEVISSGSRIDYTA